MSGDFVPANFLPSLFFATQGQFDSILISASKRRVYSDDVARLATTDDVLWMNWINFMTYACLHTVHAHSRPMALKDLTEIVALSIPNQELENCMAIG